MVSMGVERVVIVLYDWLEIGRVHGTLFDVNDEAVLWRMSQ